MSLTAARTLSSRPSITPVGPAHLAGQDDAVGGDQGLAGHPGVGIGAQEGVDHRVGDPVGHLVRMALGDGFAGEQIGRAHRPANSTTMPAPETAPAYGQHHIKLCLYVQVIARRSAGAAMALDVGLFLDHGADQVDQAPAHAPAVDLREQIGQVDAFLGGQEAVREWRLGAAFAGVDGSDRSAPRRTSRSAHATRGQSRRV